MLVHFGITCRRSQNDFQYLCPLPLIVPLPEIVNPFTLSALTRAAKYFRLCPSMRVLTMAKLLMSSLPFNTEPSSIYRCVRGLKKIEPLRKVPLGTTMTPPPFRAARSITACIFSVWRIVLSFYYTIIGYGIFLSQCFDVYDFVLSEPVGDRRTIGGISLVRTLAD